MTVAPEPPRPPPWWKTLRADPPAYLRLALGAAMISLVFFIWWLLTRGEPTEAIISPVKMPAPGPVLDAANDLKDLEGRPFEEHVWVTMARILKGVGYAAFFGITLGVLAGSFRAVSAALAPVVIFLRSIPIAGLMPLVFAFATGGEQQKTLFVFLAVVPFVFSDTIRAISSVPQRYVETAETLGASKSQIIRKVLFPLALPDIITSLRFQFGLAFGYIMLAEAIAAEHGLGAMLNVNEKRGNIEQNYLLLFVIAAIAFVIDWGVRTLQRGVFPYRKDL